MTLVPLVLTKRGALASPPTSAADRPGTGVATDEDGLVLRNGFDIWYHEKPLDGQVALTDVWEDHIGTRRPRRGSTSRVQLQVSIGGAQVVHQEHRSELDALSQLKRVLVQCYQRGTISLRDR